MIQNPLFLSLSACKQRTSDYVSTLIQNPYKTHTKRYRTYFVSILYLFCIIPNTKPKYIYINNLSGYVSLFRLHRPYIHILLSHWLCLLLNNRQIKNIKRAFQYLREASQTPAWSRLGWDLSLPLIFTPFILLNHVLNHVLTLKMNRLLMLFKHYINTD